MLITADTFAVKLYKWTDSSGTISYQDSPPPGGQKFEEKSFSDQGSNTQTNAEASRAKAAIDQPVTLYNASNCESCDLIRTVLEINGIPYEKIEVEDNPTAQQTLTNLVGSIRVPSLTIGNSIINRFDRTAIENALKKNGYPIDQPQN